MTLITLTLILILNLALTLSLTLSRIVHSSFTSLYNLSGQSIQTSMQNLETVAQKMAELLHNYIIIT